MTLSRRILKGFSPLTADSIRASTLHLIASELLFARNSKLDGE